jgi:hypothetical protein
MESFITQKYENQITYLAGSVLENRDLKEATRIELKPAFCLLTKIQNQQMMTTTRTS